MYVAEHKVIEKVVEVEEEEVEEKEKTRKLEKTMVPMKNIPYNPLMMLLYHHVSVRGHFKFVCHAVRSKRIGFHKTFVVGIHNIYKAISMVLQMGALLPTYCSL